MKLNAAIKELASRFGKDEFDDKFRALAIPKYNLAHFEVGKSWDWKELETFGSIVAVTNVEGTVAITNGARTVTIAGSDPAWKGRFFSEQEGGNIYRIVDVTGNVLTFDQDIIEGTGTISYRISKIFYTVPSEARRIIEFDRLSKVITSRDHSGLRQSFLDYNSNIRDIPLEISGKDDFAVDYSTGTLAATAGSTTFTGTGTAWLDNVQSGDIVNFGNQDYTVRRVETDLKIISYNKAASDNDGSYTISKSNAKTARLRTTFTTARVIPFTYIRYVHNLVNGEDQSELNRDADLAVLDFAEAYIAEALPLTGWSVKLQKAQLRLQAAQAKSDPLRSAFKHLPPLIPQGNGRGNV